jgi:hypothetical protein
MRQAARRPRARARARAGPRRGPRGAGGAACPPAPHAPACARGGACRRRRRRGAWRPRRGAARAARAVFVRATLCRAIDAGAGRGSARGRRLASLWPHRSRLVDGKAFVKARMRPRSFLVTPKCAWGAHVGPARAPGADRAAPNGAQRAGAAGDGCAAATWGPVRVPAPPRSDPPSRPRPAAGAGSHTVGQGDEHVAGQLAAAGRPADAVRLPPVWSQGRPGSLVGRPIVPLPPAPQRGVRPGRRGQPPAPPPPGPPPTPAPRLSALRALPSRLQPRPAAPGGGRNRPHFGAQIASRREPTLCRPDIGAAQCGCEAANIPPPHAPPRPSPTTIPTPPGPGRARPAPDRPLRDLHGRLRPPYCRRRPTGARSTRSFEPRRGCPTAGAQQAAPGAGRR